MGADNELSRGCFVKLQVKSLLLDCVSFTMPPSFPSPSAQPQLLPSVFSLRPTSRSVPCRRPPTRHNARHNALSLKMRMSLSYTMTVVPVIIQNTPPTRIHPRSGAIAFLPALRPRRRQSHLLTDRELGVRVYLPRSSCDVLDYLHLWSSFYPPSFSTQSLHSARNNSSSERLRCHLSLRHVVEGALDDTDPSDGNGEREGHIEDAAQHSGDTCPLVSALVLDALSATNLERGRQGR
ncbi:hypothetical protein C8Q76DRAFT_215481 [Earliella scabrosa]|nr:hypothetical protein C8Q76DRAFT_215481 [Earliella scabrosa]